MFLKKSRKRIFLDYASITPAAKEAAEAMAEYSRKNFANPSALYEEGMRAKQAMKDSREKIARILGARAGEIVFASGGTESDNLALLGVFEAARQNGIGRPHIIATKIEHPAILEVCREIEKRGGEVSYISVSPDGLVSPKDIPAAIKENTFLVSVMYANNEIGTIQPIKEIGKLIKEWRVKKGKTYPYFHTDACQAVLYCPLNVSKLGVDLMTLDGVKMHGPRGAGILFVRDGVEIRRTIFGGGQENGLRSGTENVAGMVGLAVALELADKLRESESARLAEIRDYAIEKIRGTFPQATLNGSPANRLPNNVNICFPGTDGEYMVVALDVEGICASYSSSCQTNKENSSSYVVSALGKPNCAASSLRITLGRETKKEDMDALVKSLKKIVIPV
jgi:cysteine desulfurase